MDPRLIEFDPYGTRIHRQNASGPGVSEFVYHDAGSCDWAFLVVRRVSGEGLVTLRVHEADNFLEEGRSFELPGIVSASPNYGSIKYSAGISTVIPSRVTLDPSAHAVTVLDGWGMPIPGWPVFVFPQSSADGGLTQPMVWNLDGEEGDEIVISSDFGSIYFFNNLGAYNEIELAFNRPLSSPVGIIADGGARQVVVVDGQGVLRIYSWGPVLEAIRDFERFYPLQPAVGTLVSGQPERIVIAFRDGTLSVLDSTGQDLPGWPLSLAAELTLPPVLADVDEDGDREILVPVFDEDAGTLRLRIFESNGSISEGDGTLLPCSDGGSWMKMSRAVVAGTVASRDLRIEMIGLFDNDLTGHQSRWGMARAGWLASNQSFTESLPSFQVAATTNQGYLSLDQAQVWPSLPWVCQGILCWLRSRFSGGL